MPGSLHALFALWMLFSVIALSTNIGFRYVMNTLRYMHYSIRNRGSRLYEVNAARLFNLKFLTPNIYHLSYIYPLSYILCISPASSFGLTSHFRHNP